MDFKFKEVHLTSSRAWIVSLSMWTSMFSSPKFTVSPKYSFFISIFYNIIFLTLLGHLLPASAQPFFYSTEHSHLSLKTFSLWMFLFHNHTRCSTWVTRSLDSRMRSKESGSRCGQSIEEDTTVKFHLECKQDYRCARDFGMMCSKLMLTWWSLDMLGQGLCTHSWWWTGTKTPPGNCKMLLAKYGMGKS